MAGGEIQTTIAYATKSASIGTAVVVVSAAAWSWATSDLAKAECAIISAFTANVVMTWDGTTPTSTLGLPIVAGSSVALVGTTNIGNLKFIRSGGSDATVSVTLEA